MIERFKDHPYLKQALWCYIALASVDIVHHLHAALMLGDNNAMHAVWMGVILQPVAIFLVLRYLSSGKKPLFWGYFGIASLATLIPGLYHGGIHHVFTIVTAIFLGNESKNIHTLLPADNIHLWIYEITGSIEFFMAVVTAYYLYKLIRTKW